MGVGNQKCRPSTVANHCAPGHPSQISDFSTALEPQSFAGSTEELAAKTASNHGTQDRRNSFCL